MIDPRAAVSQHAKLAADVKVGPWSFIGDDVELGEGCVVEPHVVIKGPAKIGRNNHFFQFSSVGEQPQDKKFHGERTSLEMGDNNVVRECVTIHRGTVDGGGITRIGHDNLLMAYVHIAHDCILGNHIILSNNAALAGHVEVHDWVIMAGFSGMHQFCRVGEHSFVGKGCLLSQDVPPYILVAKDPVEKPCGINKQGLLRRDFSQETCLLLRRAYKLLYRRGLTLKQACSEILAMQPDAEVLHRLVDFLERSERGILR